MTCPPFVDQERTGRPQGQCTEACVATLLGVPLEAIPSLWEPGDPEGERDPGDYRWVRLLATIKARGLTWVCYDLAEPVDSIRALVRRLPQRRPRELIDEGRLFMVGGVNPDGVPHYIVALGDFMVHDPNPSRRGLANFDRVVVLVPTEDLESELKGWLQVVYPET